MDQNALIKNQKTSSFPQSIIFPSHNKHHLAIINHHHCHHKPYQYNKSPYPSITHKISISISSLHHNLFSNTINYLINNNQNHSKTRNRTNKKKREQICRRHTITPPHKAYWIFKQRFWTNKAFPLLILRQFKRLRKQKFIRHKPTYLPFEPL
jgi:hypothetical protein